MKHTTRHMEQSRRLNGLVTVLTAGFLLVAPALVVTAMAGTYKWVDEDGKVHYSDQPVEGAERVDLPKLPTYEPPQTSQRASKPKSDGLVDVDPEPDASDKAVYREFDFISPKPEQVFWNLGGRLPVQLSLSPGLREGDRIVLFLNGQQVEVMTGLGTTLTEVWRGTYSLRAVIQGPDGTARATTESGTFYVKQHSIAN